MEFLHKKPRKPDYITAIARNLRKNQTPAEEKLWSMLRNRSLCGLKFRRQVPYYRFVLDFYCKEKNICIEVDGTSHIGREEYDKARDEYLTARDIRVLRVSNDDVILRHEVVLKRIMEVATSPVITYTCRLFSATLRMAYLWNNIHHQCNLAIE